MGKKLNKRLHNIRMSLKKNNSIVDKYNFYKTFTNSFNSNIIRSVRTYVIHLLGTYVTILCNLLIL